MKQNTINKLVREHKSLLAELEWEKRVAQDKMLDPKTLSTLAKKINIKKEEIEALEDISDFAKDTGSYNERYKFNLVKFMDSSNLSNEKLNTLRRLKMKLDEQENREETVDQSSSSSATMERDDSRSNQDNSNIKNESETEIVSDSSNLDDLF